VIRVVVTPPPATPATDLLAASAAQTARLGRLVQELEAEVAAGRPQVPPVVRYLVATRADRLARLRAAWAKSGRGAAA
jgi:hypothetical protein